MYPIEYAPKSVLHSEHQEPESWTRCATTYPSPEAAAEEVEWLNMEDDKFAYRVVPA
jgi:hypothetical protein